MARDATPNAADVPDAPPAAGEDNDSNPLDGEEDDEAHTLNNIDARIRTDMIGMYIRLLRFKEGAATALYNDQQITDLDPLRELDDPTIKDLCRQIGK
jgi:hypothetical protein